VDARLKRQANFRDTHEALAARGGELPSSTSCLAPAVAQVYGNPAGLLEGTTPLQPLTGIG